MGIFLRRYRVDMGKKGKIANFIKVLLIMVAFSIIFIIVGGGRRCLTLYNSDLAFPNTLQKPNE